MSHFGQRSTLNFRKNGKRFALALTLASAMLATNAQAQPDVAERWFQIEVIIFSQGNAAVGGEEQWRAEMDRGLRYPSNWVELVEASELAPLADPQNANDANFSDDASEPNATRQVALLPSNQRELTAESRQIARSNQYKVLFHEAWRQALVGQEQAPAILITGGQQYGDHYELEGTLTVSVARYLHVTTNLWLTQFATNYGQERPDWPDLPRRPNLPFDASTPLLPSGGAVWNQLSTNNSLGEYNTILASPYVIEHISIMRETRKMYSKELHYLDHPLLGLMVKITPYQPPLLPTDN